ncbi:MAG: penicillin-binding protein 1C [Bacteroidota bacterium]|nr:penicillin-binding protein 1C [Bacteroidota bacterium]
MKQSIFRRFLKWATYSLLCIAILFTLSNFFFPLREQPVYSSIITDKDGNMMHAFLSPDEKWRMKTELHEINPLLKKTILFKEDKYFFYHPGVNPVAIIRAAFNNTIKGKKTSGASTITMQVARLLYPAKRTYSNKIIEMFRSFQLEWSYSKDEIFQLYLNLVPYGGNIEGVKAACWFYFGIQPAHVNLSQAVVLSIIPNRPGSLHPKKGTALITRERDRWLKQLRTGGVTGMDETADALNETLLMPRRPAPKNIPHLALRLRASSSNKTTITSTIDRAMQEKTESISYNHHKRLALKNIHNLSVLVIENKTRKVRAYLGSPDFNDQKHSGQVDGCNAVRSPGSTLKPMVYALAIDKGIITPQTTLEDVPVNFSGYAPENFNARCNGLTAASKALAFSLNIPAVALLNETGLSEFTAQLRKAGFKSLKRDAEMGLSVILGGCGVKITELAGMYAAMANGGAYMPLSFVESDSFPTSTQLLSEASAFMITEMLTGMMRPDLPNNYESSTHVPKIAWKTGTSYGRRDAWSIGYNRKYTIAVWVGNFNGEGVPELTGADVATPLLFDLFNAIDYSSDNNWYTAPRSADLRLVCSHSGLIPGELCSDLVTDYYIPAVSSNKKCAHSREIMVNPENTWTYCMTCAPENGYRKIFADNLPASVYAFYTANNIPFSKSPPHNPLCTQLFSEQPPVIVSPVNNKEYLLEKNASQPLQLTCNAGADISTVYWYINDRFLAKSTPSEATFFTPEEGSYKISCSDDKGRNRDISVNVKFY